MVARGSILLGISLFAFACWIVAMSTDIAWADQSTGHGFPTIIPRKTNVDPWFTCTEQVTATGSDTPPVCYRNGDTELSCQEYGDRFRVVQAFLVLVGLMLLPLMVCSALDRFALLSDVQHKLGPRTILVILHVLIIMFSIVAFSVAFSIPKTDLCGVNQFADSPGFSWGPAPFFMAIITLLSMIGLAIAALKKGYKHKQVVAHEAVDARSQSAMVPTGPGHAHPAQNATAVHGQATTGAPTATHDTTSGPAYYPTGPSMTHPAQDADVVYQPGPNRAGANHV